MSEKGVRSGIGRFDFIEDKIEGNGKTMGYYEGEWKAGSYHGEGRIVWGSTGCSYQGDWSNGVMHGYGVKQDDRTGQIIQKGNWVHGEFQEAAALNAASNAIGRGNDNPKDVSFDLEASKDDYEKMKTSNADAVVAWVKGTSETDLQGLQLDSRDSICMP